jgi:hypothetical protein
MLASFSTVVHVSCLTKEIQLCSSSLLPLLLDGTESKFNDSAQPQEAAT